MLVQHQYEAPDAPCRRCPCGLYQRREIRTPEPPVPTPFYLAFQMVLDQAPRREPVCAHTWRPIVGADYLRQVIELTYSCRQCGSVRMPTFREALRFWRIPALPQDSEAAEAEAFGHWMEQHPEEKS
jgi:hypothetical protein